MYKQLPPLETSIIGTLSLLERFQYWSIGYKTPLTELQKNWLRNCMLRWIVLKVKVTSEVVVIYSASQIKPLFLKHSVFLELFKFIDSFPLQDIKEKNFNALSTVYSFLFRQEV